MIADEPAANEHLRKAIYYLKKPLSLFILVNIPFLFIFYDVWNLNTVFYAASYLGIGLNPYFYQNQIRGGLPIQFLGLLIYDIFRSSGSNYLLTAAVLKVLFVAFTYLTGLVLAWVAKLEGLAYHRKILFAFIFNPFILFVNNVWVETDIIIIFLYVVGYVSLCYGWNRSGDYRYLVFGALCIALAILSYYSIVLLVPTLVLYRSTLRKKLQLLAALLSTGAVLSVPLFAFNLATLPGVASGLISPVATLSPYSIFNLLGPLSASTLSHLEQASLGASLVFAVAIPILLKRLGASEPVSLFVCYAVAYLFAVTEIQGDNFVLLIGVLLLALISQRLPVLTYQRIFAIQLFILPQFLVVQLLNGIPPATGMFYWTYYLFHSSPALYSLLGGVILWYGLLILYLVALVMTLGYLLPRAGTAGPPGTRTPAPRHSRLNSSPWRLHRLGPTSTILLGAVVVLAVILPVTITLDPDIGKPSGSISGFDSGLFLPLEYGSGCFVFPECASILASTGTYQVNGSNAEAYFASSSEAVGLYRNMTDQSYDLRFTASVISGTGPSIESTDVINTTSFYAGQGVAEVVNNSSIVDPTRNAGAISVLPGSPTPVLLGANQFFELGGNAVRTYNLNLPATVDRPVFFGFDLGRHPPNSELLWDLFGANCAYEAVLSAGAFYFGTRATLGADWHFNETRIVVPLERWFVAGFEVSPTRTSLSAFVNDQTLTAPYTSDVGPNVSLNLGELNSPKASDYPYNLTGTITNLYSAASNETRSLPTTYAWSSQTGIVTSFPSTGPMTVTISGTPAKPELTVDQRTIPVGAYDNLWIGKLSNSQSSVEVTFAAVNIKSSTPAPNLEVIVVDFAFVLPAVLSFWCLQPSLVRRLNARAGSRAIEK